MQYLVSNKIDFKIKVGPFLYYLFVFGALILLQDVSNINLYFLLSLLFINHIYIYFIKDFRKYQLGLMVMPLFSYTVIQIIALYVMLKVMYEYHTLYGNILLLLFMVFYYLFYLDFKIAKKLARENRNFIKKYTDKIKEKKESIYYIDEDKFIFGGAKHNDISIGIGTFYTFKTAVIIGLPIILIGKIGIAAGMISARHLPQEDFIMAYVLFIFSVMMYFMMVFGFLTYLKLDLSEEKDK